MSLLLSIVHRISALPDSNSSTRIFYWHMKRIGEVLPDAKAACMDASIKVDALLKDGIILCKFVILSLSGGESSFLCVGTDESLRLLLCSLINAISGKPLTKPSTMKMAFKQMVCIACVIVGTLPVADFSCSGKYFELFEGMREAGPRPNIIIRNIRFIRITGSQCRSIKCSRTVFREPKVLGRFKGSRN
jgi:hypothetical protein